MARSSAASILLILLAAVAAYPAGAIDSLKPGTPDLKSSVISAPTDLRAALVLAAVERFLTRLGMLD